MNQRNKKTTFIILITLLTLSCKDENSSIEDQKTISDSISVKLIEPKDEVVLKLTDSTKTVFLNLRTSLFQFKPDLMTIGIEHQNNVVVIPTDSILNLSMANSYLYSAQGEFQKGDSVSISLKKFNSIEEGSLQPYFNVTNRKVNLYELNFDYYVNLKTPTSITFSRYIWFSKRKKWEAPFTLEDVRKNIVSTADSLYNLKLISKEFHSKKIAESKILKAKTYVEKAFIEKSIINIDSLIVSNDSYSEYDFFNRYLSLVFNYKYFIHRKKYAKGSELFDAILEKDTLLSIANKTILLDNLLLKIFSQERQLFNTYKDKFKTSVSNSSKFLRKYEELLSIEQSDNKYKLKLKNATGKLLSIANENVYDFQKLLENEQGKVVLVDFWASWCAPCRREIPSIKQLLREIDSTKFSVISISTDKNLSSWKKASGQEKLEEHNYLLINPEKSSLMKDFKLYTIPRYLLYDSKGRLIDDNAPYPSDEKLKSLINELLNMNKL